MNREELFENRWAVWAGDGTTLHLVHRSGMPRALCGAVTMQDEYIGPRLIETAEPRPLDTYPSGSPVCSPCTNKALRTMRTIISSVCAALDVRDVP